MVIQQMIKNHFSICLDSLYQLNALLSQLRTRIFISVILFSIFMSSYWPGGMFSDSYTQLGQAITGKFDDWHPPIMAWIWSKLIIVGKNSEKINVPSNIAPMLLFHLGMLFSASFLMSCCKNKNGSYPWYWIFFPLVPQVIGHAGLLVKDIGMAFALFLTFALIRFASVQDKKCKRIFSCMIAFPFFLYALLLRHNAILAIPPIVYYCFLIFTPIGNRLIIYILTGICCFTLLIFTHFVDYQLIRAKKTNMLRVMYIDRICIASHFAKKNLFIVHPYNQYNYIDLPKNYKQGQDWSFYAVTPVDFNELRNNYYDIIIHEPISFIQGKLLRIKQFIFTTRPKDLTYENQKILPFYFSNNLTREKNLLSPDPPVRYNLFLQLIEYYVLYYSYQKYEFIFSKLFIVSLGCFIFLLYFNKKTTFDYQIKMLISSGMLYFSSYILITVFPDYRFSYWTFVSVLLSFFLFLENIFYNLLSSVPIFIGDDIIQG